MMDTRLDALLRRAIDLTASAIGLVLLSPLMALIALLVKSESEGPVLFKQCRLGQHSKPFTIYKFRTMQNNGYSKILVTAQNDPRITKVGRFLRVLKLDELPQLFNVFIGQMSLVGPRPEIPEMVSHWSESNRKTIHSVRPGLTDPVTLFLRKEEVLLAGTDDPERFYVETLLPHKITGYTEYIAKRTLRSDFGVLFRTAYLLFTHPMEGTS